MPAGQIPFLRTEYLYLTHSTEIREVRTEIHPHLVGKLFAVGGAEVEGGAEVKGGTTTLIGRRRHVVVFCTERFYFLAIVVLMVFFVREPDVDTVGGIILTKFFNV